MYTHNNKLTLRKLGRKDLPMLTALKNESWFGTHSITIVNDDDQNRWFDSITSSKNDLILVASTHIHPVGIFKIAGIDWMNRLCHIGHDIFAGQRGKGYGNKIVEAGVDFCFEILNMHRLDAEVLENNIASQKTLFNAGFKLEGKRKKAIHKCGQYLDSFVIGVLKEDWQELPRVKAYNGVCNISYKPLC